MTESDVDVVARTVAHQTQNTQQGPSVSVRAIVTILSGYREWTAHRARTAIKDAAIEGVVCGLRVHGERHVAPADADALLAVIERETAGEGAVDRETVAKCNDHLQRIRNHA